MALGSLQGGRILMSLIFGQSGLEEREEIGRIPSSALALGLDPLLVSALALGEVHHNFPEEGEIFGAVVGSDA